MLSAVYAINIKTIRKQLYEPYDPYTEARCQRLKQLASHLLFVYVFLLLATPALEQYQTFP